MCVCVCVCVCVLVCVTFSLILTSGGMYKPFKGMNVESKLVTPGVYVSKIVMRPLCFSKMLVKTLCFYPYAAFLFSCFGGSS